MMNYSLSGTRMGMQAPDSFANFGSGWGMSQLPNVGGEGINPAGLNLYGKTPALDAGGYTPLSTTTAAPGGGMPSWLDGMLGSTDATGNKTQGWGGLALGTAQGIGNMYMGMQQYGLAKESLQASKDQFAKNYEAQKKTTNASLEDRQIARVAANPTGYQSVGDYMKKNGIV